MSGKVELLHRPGRLGSVADRFWRKVAKAGPDDCWPWLGSPTSRGYGRMVTPWSSSTPAHRIAVMLDGRDIPDGMVVDHTCRTRMCVNPDHLRVVTPTVNTLENSVSTSAQNLRKTHCKRGHPLSGDNVRPKRGGRSCKTCHREYNRLWHQRRAAAFLQADSRRKDEG